MIEPYYDDGQITVYVADCRDVLPKLERCDLLLTDPPYGIGAARMTLGNGQRRIERGDESWDDAPPDLSPLLALDIPTVIWGGNYFPLPPQRGWFVWDKGNGDNDYADCELAWTNRDGVVKRYFRSWVGANAKESLERDRIHPTQKPVELMRWCIGFFPDAQTVLDPFAGSLTTAVAAKHLGRRCIAIEREEKYVIAGLERLRQGVLL